MKLSERHGKLVDTFADKSPQSSFTIEQLQLVTKKIAHLEAELEDERNLRYETQNKTSKRIYELEAENERLQSTIEFAHTVASQLEAELKELHQTHECPPECEWSE